MTRLAIVLGLLALLPKQDPQLRFVTVEVYAQTKDRPLAAWQIEVECDPARAKIVGVEGNGEKPPYYDSAALQGGRIILASFTMEPHPPAGRVLVARVHLEETGRTDYSVKLMAAASPGGERFEPMVEIIRAGGK
jgi:hypothetical protein